MAAYKTNCYKCGVEVVKKIKWKNPICNECKKEYQKEYRSKPEVKERKREYYQENKEDILERQKEYQKEYYQENKEYLNEYQKEYYQKNKNRIDKRQKEYRSRPDVKERVNERQKERKRTDIEFNIICRLRSRTRTVLNEYLKGQAKPQTTVEYLGCSIEYLKEYLESKFTKGMTWEEFLKGNIHIDHRIPCSWFDLNMESEREICFHYTNLQPLWAWENLEKGARFSG